VEDHRQERATRVAAMAQAPLLTLIFNGSIGAYRKDCQGWSAVSSDAIDYLHSIL